MNQDLLWRKQLVGLFVGILFFVSICFPTSEIIQPVNRIRLSQKDTVISSCSCFVVDGRKNILLIDGRENKLKIFDRNGIYVKSFGRAGQGPNEYVGLGYLDFQAPFLALFDIPRSKIDLFTVGEKFDLQKTSEIFPVRSFSRIGLRGATVIVDGRLDYRGEAYNLYSLGFDGKIKEVFLNSHIKYGLIKSQEIMRQIQDLGLLGSFRAYFDFCEDDFYYISDFDLRIIKIDSKTKKTLEFGKQTADYHKPKLSSKMKALIKGGRRDELTVERQALSWVNGVYAVDGKVGLLYASYDKAMKGWKQFLQLYKSTGEFIKESVLGGVAGPVPMLNYFSKENGHLYFMVNNDDEAIGAVEYDLLEFVIRP
jgi:hypothetical protein